MTGSRTSRTTRAPARGAARGGAAGATPAPDAVEALVEQVLTAWRVHDRINLLLLDAIPEAGLGVVPPNSRGRTVAEQFAHMDRVRRGWLVYHQTGEREKAPRVAKGAPIPKATLRAALRESGEAVGRHLRASLTGGAGIRMFTGQPVRWMGYLIAHESHHRGQILLGLKQRGMRLPERVALQGVWGKWFWGK